jgi:hypothetical protein
MLSASKLLPEVAGHGQGWLDDTTLDLQSPIEGQSSELTGVGRVKSVEAASEHMQNTALSERSTRVVTHDQIAKHSENQFGLSASQPDLIIPTLYGDSISEPGNQRLRTHPNAPKPHKRSQDIWTGYHKIYPDLLCPSVAHTQQQLLATLPDVFDPYHIPMSSSSTDGYDFGSQPPLRPPSNMSASHNAPSSPATRLPNELLHKVFLNVCPQDFNSARHCCRGWMRASLEPILLKAVLKRGGWWTSKRLDVVRDEFKDCDPWILSKMVSRECGLAPGWKGNGLRESPHLLNRRENGANTSVLTITATTDFAELAYGYAGPGGRHTTSLVFSASVCGEFILAAEGSMIYVYHARGISIRPVTRILCPRKVLAMCVDVSSQRCAIAALLEGRMGIVCDLDLNLEGNPTFLWEPVTSTNKNHSRTENVEDHATRLTFSRMLAEGFPFVTSSNAATAEGQSRSTFRKNQVSTESLIDAIDVQNGHDRTSLRNASSNNRHDENMINRTWNINVCGHCPPSRIFSHRKCEDAGNTLEYNGQRTIHRHICSEDDPPRSVALCPQRKCTAYGCSGGIELYWVDAVTGQDLSRWFPLTVPSDFTYFLLPRLNVDPEKKLRLISSSAHPQDRPSIIKSFCSSRPISRSFEGTLGTGDRRASALSSYPTCDHFRAVPLSDGHHILFTDSASGLLALGCDARIGSSPKLLRRILFRPPSGLRSTVPRIYTVANDLTEGIRVVAGYNGTVILYVVPPDIFAVSTYEESVDTGLTQVTTKDHSIDHSRTVLSTKQDGAHSYRAVQHASNETPVEWLGDWLSWHKDKFEVCHQDEYDVVGEYGKPSGDTQKSLSPAGARHNDGRFQQENDDSDDNKPVSEEQSQQNQLWPLVIRGVQIGVVPELVEVAIQTKPDLSI